MTSDDAAAVREMLTEMHADNRVHFSVRLVAALERALDRIEFFSKYTKNPPEVVYDQWAYERFLRFVHDENKATLAGIRKDLEGRS